MLHIKYYEDSNDPEVQYLYLCAYFFVVHIVLEKQNFRLSILVVDFELGYIPEWYF